jgi:plasmid replication initiation protein
MKMANKPNKNNKIPRPTVEAGLQTIPKHNSSIHVSTKLSLLGRKLMNALLYQAYDYLPVQEAHSIDIKTLGALIGFDSNNTAHLKEAITELTQTTIEWDIINPEGKKPKWKISTLLASAEVDGGVCTYEYSGMLRRELYNPDKWTRINLAIQREFTSVYALILYENCVRFRGVKTTGQWDIDAFRRLLGVDEMPSYSAFRVLNDKIIKPAVREVNRHSDVIITPYFTKNGRRVATIRFTVQDNKQMPLFKVEEEDQITESKAYKELIKRNMSKVFSRQAVLDFGEEYIFEQLGIADGYAAKNELQGSKQGLIRKAIADGYSKPEKLVREDRRKEAEKNKAHVDHITRQISDLQNKRRKIEKDYRTMFVEMAQSVFDVSSSGEQKEILQDFTTRFPLSSVTAHDFQNTRWASLLNWASIREYWANVRVLPCPSFEDFSVQRGIKDLDAKIAALELK